MHATVLPVFLLFENLPLVLERYYYTGTDQTRAVLRGIGPFLRKIYPFVIVGAYVLPLMHQSSLEACCSWRGTKSILSGRLHFCRCSTCWLRVCAAWAS